MDDVFDLRWREKLWLPIVATLPIVLSYSGITAIKIPFFL